MITSVPTSEPSDPVACSSTSNFIAGRLIDNAISGSNNTRIANAPAAVPSASHSNAARGMNLA